MTQATITNPTLPYLNITNLYDEGQYWSVDEIAEMLPAGTRSTGIEAYLDTLEDYQVPTIFDLEDNHLFRYHKEGVKTAYKAAGLTLDCEV